MNGNIFKKNNINDNIIKKNSINNNILKKKKKKIIYSTKQHK